MLSHAGHHNMALSRQVAGTGAAVTSSIKMGKVSHWLKTKYVMTNMQVRTKLITKDTCANNCFGAHMGV